MPKAAVVNAHVEQHFDADDVLAVVRRNLVAESLRPSTLACIETEWARGLNYYRSRVHSLGFTGMHRVLDAGCGIGHWSVALAEQNDSVSAIDVDQPRVDICARLRNEVGLPGLEIRQGSIEDLPYDSESFDAAFCAGVWMFTRPSRSLAELSRVLRPGGKLYVLANGLGWSLRTLVHRGILGRESGASWSLGGRVNLMKSEARLVTRTLAARLARRTDLPRGVFFTPRHVKQLLECNGMSLTAIGRDGEFSRAAPNSPDDYYPSRYLGFRCVFEFLAERRPDQ